MATEIQADKNSFYRLFRQYNKESILVVLVSLTLIVSIISWFRAENAIDAANLASAKTAIWQQMYSETERECRLAQLEIDDFRIALQGIEHGDKP